ncbi:hypothetical protein GCM10008018_25170 [Paenibacillus marchantiophytorum]|uniref:Uncharacterized protein n=1 Tax=Paenibacillus marchantiophytorum TaxID=1619310 RepID=A0ABQ1EMG1_9BACL|nr:hypothetical protein GCM10008018_25170 [Paenibacillus marchantiophytorum]
MSPRSKKSSWTELNKERVRHLEKLGLMRDEGRRVLPIMDHNSLRIDEDIELRLKEEKNASLAVLISRFSMDKLDMVLFKYTIWCLCILLEKHINYTLLKT